MANDHFSLNSPNSQVNKPLDWLTIHPHIAIDLGWYVECIEYSPRYGYRMDLRNPDGELIASDYRQTVIGQFFYMFTKAQQQASARQPDGERGADHE